MTDVCGVRRSGTERSIGAVERRNASVAGLQARVRACVRACVRGDEEETVGVELLERARD
jgi:hypothetical protein